MATRKSTFRLATASVLAASLLGLGACSLVQSTYEPGELEDVMRGRIPSHSDRYRIAVPAIAASRGNTAVAREGSLFVVLVGDHLKKNLAACSPGDELGVRLVRTGRRHLIVEKIYRDGETLDLVTEGLRFRMPQFVDAADVPREKFEQDVHLCMIPPEARVLGTLEDHRIEVSEFSVEKRAPGASAGDEPADAGKPRYFLTSAGSDYEVANRDPMTLMMLDFLISENREFEGGIHLSTVYDRDVRRETGVSGEVDVRWIEFGRLFFRPRA